MKPPYKVGIITVDSASNRFFHTEVIPGMLTKLSLQPPFVLYFSPAAPDMTPFALKRREAGVDAVHFSGPSSAGISAQEAPAQARLAVFSSTRAGNDIEIRD